MDDELSNVCLGNRLLHTSGYLRERYSKRLVQSSEFVAKAVT
jgi:hypothetical protein